MLKLSDPALWDFPKGLGRFYGRQIMEQKEIKFRRPESNEGREEQSRVDNFLAELGELKKDPQFPPSLKVKMLELENSLIDYQERRWGYEGEDD